MIIPSERFYAETPTVMKEVETYLGLAPMPVAFWKNVTADVYNLIIDGESRQFEPLKGKQKDTIHISDKSRKYLRDHFRESNQRLQKLLPELNFEKWGWDL